MAVISMVRKPPAWNAARGSNDKPIMMQKIASEPKLQARSTVSYAMRRMCSISPPYQDVDPAQAFCRESVRPAIKSKCPCMVTGRERNFHQAHNRNVKKFPMAGSVRIAVPASHIQSDASVESSLAPIIRS